MSKEDKEEYEPDEVLRMCIMNPDFFKLHLEHRDRQEAKKRAKAADEKSAKVVRTKKIEKEW